MTHSLTKIWIHSVFSTKGRVRFINYDLENKLYPYIKEILYRDYKSPLKIINGDADHVHLLFLINPDYSVSEIIKNIKGNSSHWINQNNLIYEKFTWQKGYGAFSVSETKLSGSFKYIFNQKEHHKSVTFEQEMDLLVKRHGLISDYNN